LWVGRGTTTKTGYIRQGNRLLVRGGNLAVQIPGEWCRRMRIREQEMDPQSAQMPYMRNVTIILYDAAVNAVTEQGLRPIADALYRLIACSDISND
jgi:hypothetical protein